MANPEPPVPATLDVRCFPTMPLDVARLRGSETWILSSPAERSAEINLWAASWHSVPAGSLPNDDRVLAYLSMAGPDWPAVKEMALRGWVLCSDGRYYHHVVCQFAVEMETKKRCETRKRDGDRARMRQLRSEMSPRRSGDVAATLCDVADEGKGREGNGSEGIRSPADAASLPAPDSIGGSSPEDAFWALVEKAERMGVARSQCAKLLKYRGASDALDALDLALTKDTPKKYVGGIIRRIENEQAQQSASTRLPSDPPNTPSWVIERREDGAEITWSGKHWNWDGAGYDHDMREVSR